MAKAFAAYGARRIGEHDWAQELADKLVALQQPDGSWVNKADRWQESAPVLTTGYALTALAIAQRAMVTE